MIAAIKENELIFFEKNTRSMEEFIRNERFLTFPEITLTNFHHLVETKKTLVIANLNTQDKMNEKLTKK